MNTAPIDFHPVDCQTFRMAKKNKKKPAKRKPKPDSAQIALSVVERAIGAKLSDGMSGMSKPK